jgi:hypothetical protein
MGFDVSATQSSALLAGFASGILGFVVSLLPATAVPAPAWLIAAFVSSSLAWASTPKFLNAYYPPPQSFLSRFPPLYYPNLTHPST